MRLIHIDCLRRWFKLKKQFQYNDGVHSYFWEELTCDLCKTGLNLKKITCGDVKTLHYLLGIEKPKSKKYVILESDIECLSKAVHVIDFQEKSAYGVGRRVTNDITVSDITVSREHALLLVVDNEVYLKDSDSKFGTFQMISKLKKLKPRE